MTTSNPVRASYAELTSQDTTIEGVEHDDFFEGDEDVLGSFAFDYEKIIAFRSTFQYAQLMFPPALVMSSLCCYPCFLKKNIVWNAEAQHVALTQDGIKYVEDRHPTLCGFSCTDAGKKSKTVPYDKLTDCDIEEPAGNACLCCVKNTLTTVNIDTASSGGAGTPENPGGFHELVLVGLKDPHAFKRAVWAMKRGEPTDGGISVPESLFMRRQPTSDLAKRSIAFDTLLQLQHDNLVHDNKSGQASIPGDLSKVDFLLADKDYATLLLDAARLKQDGLLSPMEFAEFSDRLKAKVRGGSSSSLQFDHPVPVAL